MFFVLILIIVAIVVVVKVVDGGAEKQPSQPTQAKRPEWTPPENIEQVLTLFSCVANALKSSLGMDVEIDIIGERKGNDTTELVVRLMRLGGQYLTLPDDFVFLQRVYPAAVIDWLKTLIEDSGTRNSKLAYRISMPNESVEAPECYFDIVESASDGWEAGPMGTGDNGCAVFARCFLRR